MEDLKLHGIIGGGSNSFSTWVKPLDWIDINNVLQGNINLLVNDMGLATYAFNCTTSTGQYQVDWGDGTITLYNSGTNAEHTYTIGTGQACNRGYTTFKIVISPVEGNLLTFNVVSHSLSNLEQQVGILWCVCDLPATTSLSYAFCLLLDTKVSCKYLEAFSFKGTANYLTDTSNMFYNCISLKSVDVSGFTAVTNASYMFYGCISLKNINISAMTSINTTSSMFNGCMNLTNIIIGNKSLVTNASNMFRGCYELKSVDVSGFTAVTNANNMFDYCYTLENIDVNAMTSVDTASYMFNNCISLKSIDISALSNIRNLNYIFNGCTLLNNVVIGNKPLAVEISFAFADCLYLKSIDLSVFPKVNNASYALYRCTNLKDVIFTNFAINAGYPLNADNIFSGCEQLTGIDFSNVKLTKFGAYGYSTALNKLTSFTFSVDSTFTGTSPQLDLRYNSFSAEQLNAIFTALPTLTGKTIAITGCIGAETCDTSIATAKGWTVTI